MKILVLILSYLIYINAIDNNTITIYNLSLFGKIAYKGSTKSYTVLNLNGNDLKKIYITYTIPNQTFLNNTLNYSFTNEYPKDNFNTNLQIENEQEEISSTVQENNISVNMQLNYIIIFKIKKIENILYYQILEIFLMIQ